MQKSSHLNNLTFYKIIYIIIVSIAFSINGFAQTKELPQETIDSAYWTIQKNTFRINLTFPYLNVGDIPEGSGILTGMYEWSQKRKFSLVSKIGINSYNDPCEKLLTKFSYQSYASVEQRYYFNFNRRIRKAKSILNNSGTYLGLEARYLSNAYISPNDNSFKTPSPGFKLYYTIGHQVQKNKYFINFHFGIQSNLESITNGIGIGYVLK
jgi:hypothetical protein